ncbi:hypothetical protein KHF85_09770 [Xanthomonas translucens pv. graminis]|uniref:hypothetical protein n=1 Tax=Xanthomonas graminis TaxID=3390026 RepID=UPI0025406CF3|nr:hypothetical protein [Xanthomonas translucens]WIH06643.1 hypothetical protein KHF85_09770 [Xanthomonas translucens pv. graminis]
MKLDDSQAVVCVSHDDHYMNIGMGGQFGSPSNPSISGHYLLNTSGQYAEVDIKIAAGEVYTNGKYIYPMRWYVE